MDIKVKVGTKATHKVYGKGTCTKVDYTSKAFRYLFKFEDGTIRWMSDDDCEKELGIKNPYATKE